MRNRAKCKLCNKIIESFMRNDYVTCECGEISVNHGAALWCEARSWDNFIRVDDEGGEKAVTYQENKGDQDRNVYNKEEAHDTLIQGLGATKPSKEELLAMLDEMIKSYESLPRHAMYEPITHSDQLSLLMLVSSLFKSICSP